MLRLVMFSCLPIRDGFGPSVAGLVGAQIGPQAVDGGEVAGAQPGGALGGAEVAAAAYPCDRDPAPEVRCAGTDVRYVCRNGWRGWVCDVCGARLSNEVDHVG